MRVVDVLYSSWLCAQEKDVASSRDFELFSYPLSTGRTTAHPVDRKKPTRVKLRPRRGKIEKLELHCCTNTPAMFLPDYYLRIVRCWSLESNFKRRTRHVYFGGDDFQNVRDMDLLES